jgi:hypothetical protein
MAVAIPSEAILKNHPATAVKEPRRWMILVGVIVAAVALLAANAPPAREQG